MNKKSNESRNGKHPANLGPIVKSDYALDVSVILARGGLDIRAVWVHLYEV